MSTPQGVGTQKTAGGMILGQETFVHLNDSRYKKKVLASNVSHRDGACPT